jgi:hypothetical protein
MGQVTLMRQAGQLLQQRQRQRRPRLLQLQQQLQQ